MGMKPDDWEDHQAARSLYHLFESDDDEEEPLEEMDDLADEEIEEPLEARDDEGPTGEGPTRPDSDDDEHEEREQAEDCRELGRQLVGDMPEDAGEARAALLGFVDRASRRLTELAAAHQARREAEAAERADRLSFEVGAEGEQLRRYQFGSERSLRRSLETLLKLRRGAAGAGRGPGGEEDRTLASRTPQGEAGDEEDPGAAPTTASDRAISPITARPSPPDGPGAPLVDQPGPDAKSDASAITLEHSTIAAPTTSSGVPHLPGAMPTSACERSAPASPPAHAHEDVGTPPDGAGARPFLRNEVNAPAAAPSFFQNEANAPPADHPDPQTEAAARVEAAAREGQRGLLKGLVPLALLGSAGLAAASAGPGPADVNGRRARGPEGMVAGRVPDSLAREDVGIPLAIPWPSPISAREPRAARDAPLRSCAVVPGSPATGASDRPGSLPAPRQPLRRVGVRRHPLARPPRRRGSSPPRLNDRPTSRAEFTADGRRPHSRPGNRQNEPISRRPEP
jgi:hypothetical protein